MVNFFAVYFHTPVKIQNRGKMKHSVVRYIDCVHIANQKVGQVQAYHRKKVLRFHYTMVLLFTAKKTFVIQGCKQELSGWFFPGSYI